MRFPRRVLLHGAAAAGAAAQQPAGTSEPAPLKTASVDAVSEPAPRWFTARQFATLTGLCALLTPPLKGNPGAVEAGVPVFLDFYLSQSPADRQKLYRDGLDHLEAEARRRFQESFDALTPARQAQVVQPLIVPWTFDLPAQPYPRFLTVARADIRNATQGSAAWARANAGSRARRGGPGGGYYWRPIDPVSR